MRSAVPRPRRTAAVWLETQMVGFWVGSRGRRFGSSRSHVVRRSGMLPMPRSMPYPGTPAAAKRDRRLASAEPSMN